MGSAPGEEQPEARTSSGVNTGERFKTLLEGVGKKETRREKVPESSPEQAWRRGGLGVA